MPADFDQHLRRLVQRLADQVDTHGVLQAVHQRTRRRRARHRAQAAALTLVVLATTAIGTWGLWRVATAQQPTTSPAPPTSTTLPHRQQTLATVTLGGDLRAVLTATSTTADDRASVQVTVQRPAGGAWQRLDQRLIGQRNGWSWTALSAPTSICQLAASSTNPPQLAISLLAHPPGRCSPTYLFTLQNNQLVTG
jgi:hypothetical protein